ncbi:MAG: pyruvate kinase [Clostridia bacterium]|nr:pyruvate kinase [Clostridia bacterium]
MRKTKIVCTIGPASSDENVLREMITNGMNVARLNFSHGTYDNFHSLIAKLKKLRREMGVPLAILLDTKGPEIRLGNFKNTSVEIKTGDHFTITTNDVEGDENIVSVTVKTLPACVKPGDTILIDDGLVVLKVEETNATDVKCLIVTGGTVSNHKGVNVPNIKIDMPFLSESDKNDLIFGIREDVDFVAASFVSDRDDVDTMRKFLAENGGEKIRIISKIENAAGVKNFDDILEASDGIMVARGDMGVEIDFALIPGLQKTFIRKTCGSGKMSITATQMLESMIDNTTPTRAEITDVANAVFDGTSAIMLSGETAMGKHPPLVVKTMASIAVQAEKDAEYVDPYVETASREAREKPLLAICDAAVTMANDLSAAAIVAFSISGRTSRGVSSFRPKQPIIAPTPEVKTYHQLALSWGVFPVLEYVQSHSDSLFEAAAECSVKNGFAKSGDLIVVTAGVPVREARNTNMIKLHMIP